MKEENKELDELEFRKFKSELAKSGKIVGFIGKTILILIVCFFYFINEGLKGNIAGFEAKLGLIFIFLLCIWLVIEGIIKGNIIAKIIKWSNED